MKPPTIRAIATTMGLSSSALMYLWASTPTMAAGRKATVTAAAKRIATGSRHRTPRIVAQILARYSTQTARIAPSWITISKTLPGGPWKCSNSPARMRWPVEETGRNSVMPSMRPSTTVFQSNVRSMSPIP